MSGKVVLITGAGAGIGRAMAEQLTKRGDVVYAGVRDVKRAETDFAQLKGAKNLRISRLDVREKADIQAVMERIRTEEGRLDALINNAGFGLYGAFEELKEDEFRGQMETNFFGALNMLWAVVPVMREQKHGVILNVTSILGRLVLPTGSAYSASKYALEAASEALRYELRPFNVHVSAVEPGLIRTNFKQNTVFSDKREDTQSPYAFLNRLMKTNYSGYFTPVDKCAAKIVKIMDKKKPAPRYRVGRDSIMYNFIVRKGPEWLVDMIFHGAVRRAIKQSRAGSK